MPKRTIKETLAAMPDGFPGKPGYAPSARREIAAREIERKHGNVLSAIAKIAFEATDPTLKLRALATLAPYLFPALKGIELSGPDGSSLTVEIRKVSSAPGVQPGGESGKAEGSQPPAQGGDPGVEVPAGSVA